MPAEWNRQAHRKWKIPVVMQAGQASWASKLNRQAEQDGPNHKKAPACEGSSGQWAEGDNSLQKHRLGGLQTLRE